MDNGASSYRRFLEGDNEGFVEIIRDYKDGLMLYLNGYVHNIHIAEDLMEDTFVKIYAKRPRFVEKCSFKTWLYTIGRNIAIDYLRKEGKHSVTSIYGMENILADEISLERSYLNREEAVELLCLMGKINVLYRQALYLKYFEGLSNEDIGRVLKKSNRQVENLLYRGKQSLREKLEEENRNT
ncbi:MAG: RNA polymerase sigma factor [Oscillospiraceae bacterium]|nr:RNA polymerase sigma factor [Oscillospiraceae bacterium]